MTMTISEQATAAPAVEVLEGLPARFGGGYVPERVLGRSPLGAALLARGGVSGRPVVVRVLPGRVGDDPVLRDRFLAAAERACRLSHPNVVRVFGAGLDRRPFVVMEHIPGETLDLRLDREGPFPPDETLRLAVHAAAGLAHAHANGVVHGAVGPESILLGRDGVARLVDFGLAAVAAGCERLGAGADVFRLGLLLQQMGGDHLSPELAGVVDAMLATGLSGRPSSFDVLHQLVTIGSPPGVWLAPA